MIIQELINTSDVNSGVVSKTKPDRVLTPGMVRKKEKKNAVKKDKKENIMVKRMKRCPNGFVDDPSRPGMNCIPRQQLKAKYHAHKAVAKARSSLYALQKSVGFEQMTGKEIMLAMFESDRLTCLANCNKLSSETSRQSCRARCRQQHSD